MEKWVRDILEQERKKRKRALEVKTLNKNPYLYASTTRWDKTKKKIKKVTEYIGRITKEGVIERNASMQTRSIYEYGNAQLLKQMSQDIQAPLAAAFPQRWKELLAYALVKTIRPVPLRLVKSAWEKLEASQENSVPLSPNTLSETLHETGANYHGQKLFFDSLMNDSRMLAFDLSSIFSESKTLGFAERGHNPNHAYMNQVNFMMFFSIDKQQPVMIRPLHGSVRDIKALKDALQDVNVKKATVVLDRGFASYHLPALLALKNFSFILPLRRNFSTIRYDEPMSQSFTYRERGIKWTKWAQGESFLYLFEDVKMRAEEDTMFIRLMDEKKKTRREYANASKRFGKIAILSNLDVSGEKVYELLKSREDIETCFDALKNELENDKTYLRDDDAVRGYFFVSFLSLYLHYKVLNVLRKNKLNDKVSVNEALMELSKIYAVHDGGKRRLSAIPKKVEALARTLDVNINPKP
ncbi:transposase [Candidatus Micrarchaeota archaeon]|nr:transposase [Candidatus Micrarchaeota archaeon]